MLPKFLKLVEVFLTECLSLLIELFVSLEALKFLFQAHFVEGVL